MMEWNSTQIWVQVSEVTGNTIKCDSSAWSNPPQTSIALPASGTAVTFWPGAGGFQEWDLDVMTTAMLKENYRTDSIPSGEALLPGEALPSSLYLTSRPNWFGGLAWPPFDPTRPTTSIEAIPAGYRYVHGERPGTSTGSTNSGSSSGASFLAFKNIFNPTRELLKIKYALDGSEATISIHNQRGDEIKKLETNPSGQTDWDGRNSAGAVVPSGTYTLILKWSGGKQFKRVVVVK